MQRERGSRNDLFDMGDSFSIFGGFGSLGSRRSIMPSLFGGRDPFDDPFFTHPFGSISEPGMFNQIASSSNKAPTSKSQAVVIEELNSDHEVEKEDKGPGDGEILSRSSKEPSVEYPDDDVHDWKNENADYKNQHSKVEGPRPQARSFGFWTRRVTYGGVDGAYYTYTRTRTGNDGVLIEESKEADKTTGQATHRVSRGIHDKSHSYTRRLNSDGKVDTLQTLHNLNEEELTGFEEAWIGNANKHLPPWNEGFNMHHNASSVGAEQKERATGGGWVLPSLEQSRNAGATIAANEAKTSSASGGKPKKIVRINID